MELDALYWQLAMTQAHDDSLAVFLAARGDFQFLGQTLLFDNQRVVAVGNHRRVQITKNSAAVMLDHAGLSMHDAIRADYTAAKSCTDRLMSKAYAQNGNLSGEVSDQIDGDAGFVRSAGSRRNYDFAGSSLFDFVQRDLIVATYLDLFPRLSDVLDEIKGKGVVVVEDEDHGIATSYQPPGQAEIWKSRIAVSILVEERLKNLLA